MLHGKTQQPTCIHKTPVRHAIQGTLATKDDCGDQHDPNMSLMTYQRPQRMTRSLHPPPRSIDHRFGRRGLDIPVAFADPDFNNSKTMRQLQTRQHRSRGQAHTTTEPFNTDPTSVKRRRSAAPNQKLRRPTMVAWHSCFKAITSNLNPFPESLSNSPANNDRILAGTETERFNNNHPAS